MSKPDSDTYKVTIEISPSEELLLPQLLLEASNHIQPISEMEMEHGLSQHAVLSQSWQSPIRRGSALDRPGQA
jgi:hypothetical protein